MKWLPSVLMVFGGILLLSGGNGGGVSPGPSGDGVREAFATYEDLWRQTQGQLADRLEAGEIKTEAQATEWFGKVNTELRRTAFAKLLEQEAAAFGGEKWTAKKHAETIRGYVR
jgi:hypothetical protein